MTLLICVCLIFGMIFCHIVDDYYLQGWLASAKQKGWWEKNTPDKLYRHDYLMALCCHAMSWSFMIHLPLLIISAVNSYNMAIFFIVSISLNLIIHAIVDDQKANKKRINLIVDQLIHFCQIFLTFGIFLLCYYL